MEENNLRNKGETNILERMVRAEESVKHVGESLKDYMIMEVKNNSEVCSEIKNLAKKVDLISDSFEKERGEINDEMQVFVEKYYLSEKEYFQKTAEQNNAIDLKIIKSKYEVIKVITMIGGSIIGTLALCQWVYVQMQGYSIVSNSTLVNPNADSSLNITEGLNYLLQYSMGL